MPAKKNQSTTFDAFKAYVRTYDGHGRPKLDFQKMYKTFPAFQFLATSEFGRYRNFGQAFECKVFDMDVVCGDETIRMVYREYHDANENMAYTA